LWRNPECSCSGVPRNPLQRAAPGVPGRSLLTWNLLTGAVVIVLAGFLSRADP